MQNVIHKILIYLSFVSVLAGQQVFAQTYEPEKLLETADSLFAERQYTESYKLYEQLYQKMGEFSPSMLLKMAFIEEGLGDYSNALYYLNEYYLATSDERVIRKMQDLSAEHNLKGYNYDDYDLFINFFRSYHYVILYGLLTVAIVGLAYFAIWGKQKSDKPYGFGISYVIILGLLFFLANYSIGPRQAIITADNTYIMKGPSAGAEVIHISEKGHRVKVNGQKDIWTKIEWDGQTAFVRQNNLRIINE